MTNIKVYEDGVVEIVERSAENIIQSESLEKIHTESDENIAEEESADY